MESLTEETFREKFLEEKQTGLVMFARDSCPICQELHPLMEEIEQTFAGRPFAFCSVDADAQADFYRRLKLQGTPTVLFYRDGKVCDKFTGMREYEEIEFLIERILCGR